MKPLLQRACLAAVFFAAPPLAACEEPEKVKPATRRFDYEAILSFAPSPGQDPVSEAQAAEELRGRAEATLHEIVVELGEPNDTKILVFFDADDEKSARKLIDHLTWSAKLEIRRVHPKSTTELAQQVKDGEKNIPGHTVYELDTIGIFRDEPDRELILVSDRAEVTGWDVKRAWPDPARAGVVQVQLSKDGGKRMTLLTTAMRKQIDRLAIVLNDEVLSAPIVNDVLAEKFIIQGIDDPEDLVMALLAPLSSEFTLESLRALSEEKPAP